MRAYVGKPKVRSVLDEIRKGMKEVKSGVPMQCDYAVSTCWSKKALLIEQGDRLVPWEPDGSWLWASVRNDVFFYSRMGEI
jgi:hypothetical protein